ncbi:MAG: hypothetical protein F6J96_06130 [Symploca sp. SIO1C2]|nr:hypothetical protein [Symploca sp. SIO1C2]
MEKCINQHGGERHLPRYSAIADFVGGVDQGNPTYISAKHQECEAIALWIPD